MQILPPGFVGLACYNYRLNWRADTNTVVTVFINLSYQEIVKLMSTISYLHKEGLEKGNIRSTQRIKFLAAGPDNYADISINKEGFKGN
jgi:hypothetical protein